MRSWRTLGRLLIASGVSAGLGALVWAWGNATRGPIAYRPGKFILPAALAGLFAAIGIEVIGGLQARDAKLSSERTSLLAAGGALALGLLCGVAFAVVDSLIRPPGYDPLHERLIALLAVAGFGLAAGMLVGVQRGAATLVGALSAVGLGVLWGLAVALGVGLVYALTYRTCPFYESCVLLGRWFGLEVALELMSVAGLALGIMAALSAEVALALLPRRAA